MRTAGAPGAAPTRRPAPVRAASIPPAALLGRVGAVQAEIAATRPERVLAVAAGLTRDLLESDAVLVGTRSGDEVLARAQSGRHVRPQSVGDRIPLHGTLAGLAIRTGESQLCVDASADERSDAARNAEFGIGSSVVAPLLQDGRVVGVLSATSASVGHFDETHLRMLELCASAVSARLAQALEAAVQEHLRDELADEEALRRAVLDALDEGIMVRDLSSGRVVMANAASSRILGLGHDGIGEVYDRPGWRVLREDGSELPRQDLPSAVSARTGSACREIVMGIEDPEGSVRWLSVSALPVPHPVTGEPARVVTRFSDVTASRRAQVELARSEQRLSAAQQVTGLAWWEYELAADTYRWSAQMFQLLGLDAGAPEPGMHGFLEMVHPEDRAQFLPGATDPSSLSSTVFRVIRADGEERVLQSWSDTVTDDAGTVVSLFGTTLDVTGRERAATALRESEQMFRAAFDDAPTGMTLVSLEPGREGVMLRANDAIGAMVGHAAADLVGQRTARWMHPDDQVASLEYLRALVDGAPATPQQRRLVHADGRTVHVSLSSAVLHPSSGEGPYVLTHAIDVTGARAQQLELERLAHTDTLTGLANRAALDDAVTRSLSICGDTDIVALLLLDLDRFKLVNDTLGHHVGDLMLVEVAERLRAVGGPGATVARLGGDEFVLLATGLDGPGAADDLADRVLIRLREPYTLSTGHRLVSTVSLGIAIARCGEQNASDLLREADLALYRAKDAGRDRRAVYDDALRLRAVERLDTEYRLRRALDHGGVEIHLQPVVSMRDSRPRSWEALARVRDPELGLLAPAAFIEVAEETGLITDLDTAVMERAVELLAAGAHAAIAVNVSCRTLEHPAWVGRLQMALGFHGVSGSRLLVEITESTLMAVSPLVERTLAVLRGLGVRVGLDDFGTGYSAMAYLQRFELDFLKVDRSFVAQLGSSPRAVATMRAVVDLAHAHGLVVTAEGIETTEQADIVRSMGCDLGQGWLYGRPIRPHHLPR